MIMPCSASHVSGCVYRMRGGAAIFRTASQAKLYECHAERLADRRGNSRHCGRQTVSKSYCLHARSCAASVAIAADLLPVRQGFAHPLGERLLVEEGKQPAVHPVLDDFPHRRRIRGHDPAFERHGFDQRPGQHERDRSGRHGPRRPAAPSRTGRRAGVRRNGPGTSRPAARSSRGRRRTRSAPPGAEPE